MISAAQLAAMQAVVNRAFDQTCTITRYTLADDGFAGRTQTATAVTMLATGSVYNCNTNAPSSAMLSTYAAKLGTVKSILIRLQTAQDVQAGDVIAVAGDNWLVQIILQPESYSTCQMVLASELK